MTEINGKTITEVVKKLCIDANYYIGNDVENALKRGYETETKPLAKEVLGKILENSQIAGNENMPICQDTGMAVVFIEIGQDVHVTGNLEDAINEGVRKGYCEGYLRKSVVKDPLDRVNTNDNTPAVVHYEIVEGDEIKITVAPKGFGSENMSGIKMLKPSDGKKGILDYVIELISKGGGNPCPPIVVGIGIGGTMEKAALLSKKALLLPVDYKNPNPYYNDMQCEILQLINESKIGPMGWGGDTTALGVNILTYPTHIAGLPLAVNIGCHVTRHKTAIISSKEEVVYED
ncbi:MAG: fumarate hydratase [Clostridia bacterium]|nr:fumarate hydratase [Clostridia bacterium]